MATNKTITNGLREARRAAGLKQIELAARAGVSLATVNRTERWGFHVTAPIAERLAKALRTDAVTLFPYLAGKDGVA